MRRWRYGVCVLAGVVSLGLWGVLILGTLRLVGRWWAGGRWRR